MNAFMRRWAAVVAAGVVLLALAISIQVRPAGRTATEAGAATQQPRIMPSIATTPGPVPTRVPTQVPAPSFGDPTEVGPWSPARYAFDWPGAPRREPNQPPLLIHLLRGDDAHWDPSEGRWEGVEHVDPMGDGAPDAPWLDITEVRAGWGQVAAFSVELAAEMPRPRPSPKDSWMAFGIVLDANHDGRPDIRLGIDNMPSGEHRAWRTDYRFGLTAWKAGPSYGRLDQGLPKGTSNDTWYPGEDEEFRSVTATLRYLLEPGEERAHFYAWASLIEDGRVVGTDYAPDAGWLVFDDGELDLLGNAWEIESVTWADGEASVQDWFSMRATFGLDGALTIDACGQVHAFALVDDSAIRLRNLVIGPSTGCRDAMEAIDRVVRAIVTAPMIEYELEGGVLVLRAGALSIRLIGTTEPY